MQYPKRPPHQQHEKAVAAALEPLQRRQVAALDQLLRRATQANDLDTAVKIRAELQKLGIVAPGSPATPGAPGSDEARRAALRAQLRDSRWALGDGKTITLHADGSTSASWHGKHGTWKVIAPEQAELSFSNSLSLRVATFDAGGRRRQSPRAKARCWRRSNASIPERPRFIFTQNPTPKHPDLWPTLK